jgi:thiol-disulfide isomerase/thioredoxin
VSSRTPLTVVVLVCVWAVPPAAVGRDETPSPAERLAVIQKQHTDAEDEYRKAAGALPETEEGQRKADALWKAFDKGQAERFRAAVEIARAEPKSDAAFAALEWVLTIPRAYYLPAGGSAMELMTAHHADNPKVGKAIAWVGYYRPRQGENQEAAAALIDAVAKKNRDRAARGQAFMALAWEAGRKFAAAEYKKASDADRLAAEAEKAFALVEKDYGDCRRLIVKDARTLGEEAKQELHALRHLRVGKVAPEIEGEDLDGKGLRLGDYRGKVVVLVFTGSWCGPCRAMYPQERALVKRHEGKPFALLGVNSDADRDKAKQHVKEEKNDWRCFWNGPQGPRGPIARAWNVRGWPSLFVLDGKGVIRYKDLRGKELDEAVDALLAEMESGKKK